MKKILSILILLSGFVYSQQPGTLLKPSAINGYTTNGKVLITANDGTYNGVPTWQTKTLFLKNTVKSNTLTTNYIPKAIGSDSLGNSTITENGGFIRFNSPTLSNENVYVKWGKKLIFNKIDSTELFRLWSDYSTNTFCGLESGAVNNYVGGGVDNTFYGYVTGQNNTTGSANSFFGKRAGQNNTTASDNSFFGAGAGQNNITGGLNSYFGYHAGVNSLSSNNAMFGAEAGSTNTTGSGLTFIGKGSGFNNQTGNGLTFVGFNSGISNTTGNNSTHLGTQSGYSNTDGSLNCYIGAYSGYGNVHGNYNTSLGTYAGYSVLGDKNVFIGFQAGQNETGSNKLYVDVSSTSTPLLGGDFATRSLTKNGNEIATTNQLPVITASTGIIVSGTTPNYTISATTQTTGLASTTSPTITSPTFSTSSTYSYATANTVPIINSSKQLVSSSTTTTQLSYLDATSSIQTQLDGKLLSTKERLLTIGGFASFSPADATTYYFGEYLSVTGASLQNTFKFQFNDNFTITKVIIELRCSVNASNESVAFYLRESATTDNTITTSLDMSTIGANTNKVFVYTPTISVSSGLNYEFKIVTPAWVTNPTVFIGVVKLYGY